ncbi:MAG: hypothetical protein ACD_9C00025G0006 [uncultured bacterium]|nr:MAG: hypothetical protein ACD_9C00025G0006 [uncultured bacterium]
MEKIKLEEWRVGEIGKLMMQAAKLSLDENERQRLFIEISHTISIFGLYETAEKIIQETVQEFSSRLRPQSKGEKP